MHGADANSVVFAACKDQNPRAVQLALGADMHEEKQNVKQFICLSTTSQFCVLFIIYFPWLQLSIVFSNYEYIPPFWATSRNNWNLQFVNVLHVTQEKNVTIDSIVSKPHIFLQGSHSTQQRHQEDVWFIDRGS